MGQIINKSKEFYPDLEGAEYLVYEGIEIPEGVTISKNNVLVSSRGELKIRPAKFEVGGSWGWSSGSSFCRNFNSPEEAIAEYHKFISSFQK